MADFDPTSIGAVPVAAKDFDPASIGAVPVEKSFDPTSLGAVPVDSTPAEKASPDSSTPDSRQKAKERAAQFRDYLGVAPDSILGATPESVPALDVAGAAREGIAAQGASNINPGRISDAPLVAFLSDKTGDKQEDRDFLNEEASKPVISLPTPAGNEPAAIIARTIANGVSAFTTPQNIQLAASLGPAAGGPLAKAVATGFSADMLHSGLTEIGEGINDPTTEGKIEKITSGILSTALGAGAGGHGLGRENVLPEGTKREPGLSQEEVDRAVTQNQLRALGPEPVPLTKETQPALPEVLDGLHLARERWVAQLRRSSPGESDQIQSHIDDIDAQLLRVDRVAAAESAARVAQRGESPPPAEGEVPSTETGDPPVEPITDPALHQAAEASAQSIADAVTKGQPDTVREAAYDAAIDNARSSLKNGKSPSASFMRKAAQEAAGKAAQRQAKSLNAENDAGTTKLEATPSGEASPAEEAAKADTIKEVRDTVSELPENLRKTAQAFLENPDLSRQELADKLGVSRTTVADHLKAMQEHFEAIREGGISLGPGAASALEKIKNELEPTGLKKATVDVERLSRGADPLPTPERQHEEGVIRDAEDTVHEDPTLAPSLVSRIVDKGDTAITEKDAGVLLVERRRVMNERAAWEDRLGREEDVDEARRKLSEIETQLDRLDRAQRAAGTTWGRLGHMYQRMIRDDYTLESLERKERAVKGRPLTEDERATIKTQADKIEALQKDLDEKQKALSDAGLDQDVQHFYEATINELGKSYLDKPEGEKIDKRITAIAKKLVEGLNNQADAALTRIRARRAEGRLNALAVEDFVDYTIYGAAKIASKGLDFAKWSAEMVTDLGDLTKNELKKIWKASNTKIDQLGAKNGADSERVTKAVKTGGGPSVVEAKAAAKADATAGDPLSHKVVYGYVEALIKSGVHGVDALMKAAHKGLKESFPELTERDVRRAFSEYGKVKFPSKDAVKVELAETRRITQLQESIDRLNEGLDALHTGLQREKATQQVREKTKELNELLKKRAGPATPKALASRDQAKQTALRNAIADLDKQLKTGEKPIKGTPAPDSTATEQLRAERDAMKAKLDEIENASNPPKTAAEKQVEQLSKIREKLSDTLSGKRPPDAPKDWNPLSAAAEDIKAEITAMHELAAQLKREAKPPTDSGAAAEKAKIKALEKAIKDYEDRTAKGDFTGKGQKLGPDSATVAGLKAIRDARRDAYEAARDAGKPVRTPEQIYNERRLKQVEKRTTELEAKTAAGDFTKPTKPVPPAKLKETVEAEVKLKRAQLEFNAGVEKQRLANRTPSQKFWDHFVGVERAMKLSSDVVLGKLTVAAALREAVLTPAEELVGGAISKALPGLAARAPREGGFNLDAEIKAKQEAFTSGMRDAWDNLRMRQSQLDILHGKEKNVAPSWYEYFGFLHGALKSPVKRAEFARSLEKRMKAEKLAGGDLNDVETMGRLSQEAYADGQRAIFMQDNVLSSAFNTGLRSVEMSRKYPNLGPAVSRIGRFLLPIVKVPTNIFGEVATGVHGTATGALRAGKAYYDGIESLPKEQGDAIMRQLKKGLIGNALLLTGYLGYKGIGGFYQPREQREESDVQPDHYRVGKANLPGFVGHSTAAMLLNLGASFRRAELQGKSGTSAAGRGLIKQLPFVPVATNAVEALESDGALHKFVQQMAINSTVPALVSHVAKVADTPGTFPGNAFEPATRRFPTNDVEAIKATLPGLRSQVPDHRKNLRSGKSSRRR